MRQSRSPIMLVLLLLFLVTGAVAYLQNQSRPVVGFVVSRLLLASSNADDGPDGLTRLDAIFRSMGANTIVIRLDEPLPDNLDVIVLVSPLGRITDRNVARIWSHLYKGGSLLVALDPNGYQFVNSERANDGLNRLLYYEYGSSFEDNFLIEQWFSPELLEELDGAHSLTYPEPFVAHSIVSPLVERDVPIHIWGARSIEVEPFGTFLSASPLIYSDTAYGERADFLRDTDPLPLEVNIGVDDQPRLLVGGIGVDLENGSRVAVFGDGQIFQNGFGLARVPGADVAAYPGNQLLVERTAAWLLRLPEEEWPRVPVGYTWNVIDGEPTDWDVNQRALSETLPVRAFHNDSFLYMMIEPPENYLDSGTEVTLTFDAGGRAVSVALSEEGAAVTDSEGRETAVADADFAVGSVLEMRVPLRLIGLLPTVTEICVSNEGGNGLTQECLNQRFNVRFSDQFDPSPLHVQYPSLAFVPAGGSANIRSSPDPDAPVLGTALPTMLFVVVGYDESGGWVEVENARYHGWIARSVLTLAASPSGLGAGQGASTSEAEPVLLCSMGVTDTINRRSGPSTDTAVVGQLEAGATVDADGQAVGDDGRVWWRLTDGSWVRSDTVVEFGACELLPEVSG